MKPLILVLSFLVTSLCNCTLTTDPTTDGNGSITGGTLIDNPVVATLVTKKSTDSNAVISTELLVTLELYLTSDPSTVMHTIIIEIGNDFSFTNIPYGTYDIVSKASLHGALFKNILINASQPEYHIDSLYFYDKTPITIEIGERYIESIAFYNEPLPTDTSGDYIFNAINIPFDSIGNNTQELIIRENSEGQVLQSSLIIDTSRSHYFIEASEISAAPLCTELGGALYESLETGTIIAMAQHENGSTILIDRIDSLDRVFISTSNTLQRVAVHHTSQWYENNHDISLVNGFSGRDLNSDSHINITYENNSIITIQWCETPTISSDSFEGCEEMDILDNSTVDSFDIANFPPQTEIQYLVKDENDRYLLVSRKRNDWNGLDVTVHYGAKGNLVKREVTQFSSTQNSMDATLTFTVGSSELVVNFYDPESGDGEIEPSTISENNTIRDVEYITPTETTLRTLGVNCNPTLFNEFWDDHLHGQCNELARSSDGHSLIEFRAMDSRNYIIVTIPKGYESSEDVASAAVVHFGYAYDMQRYDVTYYGKMKDGGSTVIEFYINNERVSLHFPVKLSEKGIIRQQATITYGINGDSDPENITWYDNTNIHDMKNLGFDCGEQLVFNQQCSESLSGEFENLDRGKIIAIGTLPVTKSEVSGTESAVDFFELDSIILLVDSNDQGYRTFIEIQDSLFLIGSSFKNEPPFKYEANIKYPASRKMEIVEYFYNLPQYIEFTNESGEWSDMKYSIHSLLDMETMSVLDSMSISGFPLLGNETYVTICQ